MTEAEGSRRALEEALSSAALVAKRLAKSRERVASMMPINASALATLSDVQEEAVEALLFRYLSLFGIVQDQIFRGIIKVQEEDVRDRTRRDQRLFMEKIGALPAEVEFARLAESRNRVTHHYPDRRERQAWVVNDVFVRSAELLMVHDAVDAYARKALSDQRLSGVAPPSDPP